MANVCNFYWYFLRTWWRIITNLAISASEKYSHIVYLLSVQIVTMFAMLNEAMKTEITQYAVSCGTVCFVCKLYFHLTTLKTTRIFSSDHGMCLWLSFSISWCSFNLKLMKAKTPHWLEWIQISNFTQAHTLPLNTRCDYFIEHEFLSNIADKISFRTNRLSLFHIYVKSCPNTMMS